MKTVRKYQVIAKVGPKEYSLELLDTRKEAETLAEEYALGKEAVWNEPHLPMQEQPGNLCVTFIPTNKLDAVYVTPVDVPVEEKVNG